MTRYTKLLALGLICAAGLAVAKEGVTNPAVKARQAAMATIGASAKVLGDMASGKSPFDAGKAAEAAGAISGTAVTVSDLFRAEESDPQSDAKPDIWSNYPDFEAKAEALFKASLSFDSSTPAGVQAGMAALGGACKSCHSTYRN
jgi:cytochrome c556